MVNNKLLKFVVISSGILMLSNFYYSTESFGANNQSTVPTAIHVQQIDSNTDLSTMQMPGVKVHTLEELNKNDLPSVNNRDSLLETAGLSDEVKNWDQLEKDLLFIRAKGNNPEKKLKEKYPGINVSKLNKLARLVNTQ